eukprot:Skav218780  [mRNA]  locus=scaffold1372:415549:420987:- [translate_table: standard]
MGWCCEGEASSDEEDGLTEVIVHVYDVSHNSKVEQANDILYKLGTGIFHAAVEVYGLEWSYGKSKGSGVFCCPPRSCKAHHFRESVPMGRTRLTKQEVQDILEEMKQEWRGPDYELLKHNCTHFSDELWFPAPQTEAGSIDAAVITLLEKGRERREAKHGED